MALMGGDAAAVDSYIQQRSLGAPATAPIIPGLPPGGSSDMAYTIMAVAEIEGQQGAGVLTTIRRGPGIDGSPFTVLRWKPYVIPPKATPNSQEN
jgi:hypothetical protein